MVAGREVFPHGLIPEVERSEVDFFVTSGRIGDSGGRGPDGGFTPFGVVEIRDSLEGRIQVFGLEWVDGSIFDAPLHRGRERKIIVVFFFLSRRKSVQKTGHYGVASPKERRRRK